MFRYKLQGSRFIKIILSTSLHLFSLIYHVLSHMLWLYSLFRLKHFYYVLVKHFCFCYVSDCQVLVWPRWLCSIGSTKSTSIFYSYASNSHPLHLNIKDYHCDLLRTPRRGRIMLLRSRERLHFCAWEMNFYF